VYEIHYFKPNGKYYTVATLEYGGELSHAVAKIRGLRDNGGQGGLPGLSGEGWDGPILIKQVKSGLLHILMPSERNDT
jgi:hypothetical protein